MPRWMTASFQGLILEELVKWLLAVYLLSILQLEDLNLSVSDVLNKILCPRNLKILFFKFILLFYLENKLYKPHVLKL